MPALTFRVLTKKVPMFDKANFAAALLVLSTVVLPGCGG
jgi:hypothetical protein